MSKNRQKLLEEFALTMLKANRLGTEVLGISLHGHTTVLQMQALLYIKDNSGLSIGELGKILNMSSPAIAQFTNRLCQAGYVLKESDAFDHRTTRLSLTSLGIDASGALPSMIRRNANMIFHYLSEDDIRSLIHIYTKILHTLEEREKDYSKAAC